MYAGSVSGQIFNSLNSLQSSPQTYPYKDIFGNSYKSSPNLWNDCDGDGYINLYDRHDKNPNVGYMSTPVITEPSYYNNYKSSSYDLNSGRTIYEGPRGGNYYINSNGNKTYIRTPKSQGW